MLQEIEKIHDEAMELLDQAQIARLNKDMKLSHELKQLAYEKESQAANMLLNEDIEPSRSILFRSAASIAFDLCLYVEAEKLVCTGLVGNPPDWVAEELRDLYEDINQGRHLEVKGVQMSDEEFQMSLTGNDVGNGFARFEDYLPRAGTISKIIQRTAQRKTGDGHFQPRVSKDITAKYTPYVSEPRAASFAVTFRIAVPHEQLEVFEEVPKNEILREVLDCIELLEHDKLDELRARIGSEEYYQNFLGLAESMLPDGDSIKSVGFTYMDQSIERKIVVKRTKEHLVESANDTDKEASILEGLSKGDEVVIRGVLQVADKSKDKPEIKIKYKGILYTIRVPESQIDDVVRPLWDRPVLIKGKKHSKTIIEMEKIQEDNDTE